MPTNASAQRALNLWSSMSSPSRSRWRRSSSRSLRRSPRASVDALETGMTVHDAQSVVDWLNDGARSAPMPDQVLAQLCERLVQCGVPLWRVAVYVRTLHPQVMGRQFIWQHG